jgi:mannose-1-phosphate guanylyltransferase/mannose-1-phosphate guanylyltransferase/mannose-6-phosphate isomerase
MAQSQRRIVPILLSGGTGARLWPLSRETYPKQLLPLIDDSTLLQRTVQRVGDRSLFAPPLVIANAEHRFLIAEQMRALGVNDPTIILEPVGRNTAPAAAIAALAASAADPEAVILLLPVDHLVRDVEAFRRAVTLGFTAASAGRLVLFGIPPTTPATGYGYIEASEEIDGLAGVRAVAGFVEKPALEAATRYVASGRHLWNSGVFLMSARVLLAELARLAPAVLDGAGRAFAEATHDLDFLRLAAAPFAACPAISIDYAVMEKTDKAALVSGGFDWSDVGSWSALWEVSDKDAEGNVKIGDVMAQDARGCYLHGEGPLVAVLGVEDLIVTATPDVVLVTRKDRDQDV